MWLNKRASKNYFVKLLHNKSNSSKIHEIDEVYHNGELYIDILTAVYDNQLSVNDIFYTKISHREMYSIKKVNEFIDRLYIKNLIDTDLIYNVKYVTLTEYGKEFVDNLGLK